MFSRWTSTPSGAVRCTGAKFQTARTPPSTRAFKHPCAAEAGTVRARTHAHGLEPLEYF